MIILHDNETMGVLNDFSIFTMEEVVDVLSILRKSKFEEELKIYIFFNAIKINEKYSGTVEWQDLVFWMS